MAPTTLEELCKRIQHCCATLRRSRNKRIVGSCWLKSLTGFKLCATSNNMQQGVQTDATWNIQQCWELLANNVVSVCSTKWLLNVAVRGGDFFLFSHVLRLIILGNRNVYSAYVSVRRERALGFDFKLSWFMELSLISCGEAVSYNFKFEYNEFIQKLWMILWWYYFRECISCAKLLAN